MIALVTFVTVGLHPSQKLATSSVNSQNFTNNPSATYRVIVLTNTQNNQRNLMILAYDKYRFGTSDQRSECKFGNTDSVRLG